ESRATFDTTNGTGPGARLRVDNHDPLRLGVPRRRARQFSGKDVRETNMTEEIERLQGIWRILSLEVEGSKMEDVFVAGSKVIVAGGRVGTGSDGGWEGGVRGGQSTRGSPK